MSLEAEDMRIPYGDCPCNDLASLESQLDAANARIKELEAERNEVAILAADLADEYTGAAAPLDFINEARRRIAAREAVRDDPR